MRKAIAALVCLAFLSSACVGDSVRELPPDVNSIVTHAVGDRTSAYYVGDYSIAGGVITFEGYWRATSRGVPQGYIWIDEVRLLSGDWIISRTVPQR